MYVMKKILVICSLILIITACKNEDITFDDYDFQGVYFPFQTPIRTLMLGETIGDNSIDLDHAFSIGVALGGVYKNTKDRDVTIEYAPELSENIISGSDTLYALPSDYYNATFGKMTIPAGSYNAKVRVNLTDKFFEDPLTTGLKYVIPLRITQASDSILSGVPNPTFINHDIRVAEHWDILPKNYTLFAVKYINAYHGLYLLRGQTIVTEEGLPNDTITYSEQFLIKNGQVGLSTLSLTESVMPKLAGSLSDTNHKVKLIFDPADGTVAVEKLDINTVNVSKGEGVFFSPKDAKAESYNGKKHTTIYLNYKFDEGTKSYESRDSLVFIDNDMTYEEFIVTVYEK